MPTILDNPKAISLHDTKDMLGAVEKFQEFMSIQVQMRPPSINKPERSVFRNIVLMGMGGSASAGDLVVDWLVNRISVPMMVHGDPVLRSLLWLDTMLV